MLRIKELRMTDLMLSHIALSPGVGAAKGGKDFCEDSLDRMFSVVERGVVEGAFVETRELALLTEEATAGLTFRRGMMIRVMKKVIAAVTASMIAKIGSDSRS